MVVTHTGCAEGQRILGPRNMPGLRADRCGTSTAHELAARQTPQGYPVLALRGEEAGLGFSARFLCALEPVQATIFLVISAAPGARDLSYSQPGDVPAAAPHPAHLSLLYRLHAEIKPCDCSPGCSGAFSSPLDHSFIGLTL